MKQEPLTNLIYRKFKVFGRSQLLLATGHVHTVVHCQSPSGDGSYLHVLSHRWHNSQKDCIYGRTHFSCRR